MCVTLWSAFGYFYLNSLRKLPSFLLLGFPVKRSLSTHDLLESLAIDFNSYVYISSYYSKNQSLSPVRPLSFLQFGKIPCTKCFINCSNVSVVLCGESKLAVNSIPRVTDCCWLRRNNVSKEAAAGGLIMGRYLCKNRIEKYLELRALLIIFERFYSYVLMTLFTWRPTMRYTCFVW